MKFEEKWKHLKDQKTSRGKSNFGVGLPGRIFLPKKSIPQNEFSKTNTAALNKKLKTKCVGTKVSRNEASGGFQLA